MAVKSAISLNNFFIFNSTLGPREGEEHKKILYFYPDNVDIDKKIKQVGLCEAVIQFTRNFTDKPCESVRTQQTHQVFFEPEPNYWVVMTVNIPYSVKTNKTGQKVKEHHEGDVQDPVFKAVLSQAYEMFRLLNDTFVQIVTNGDLQSLIFRLEHFFNKYLPAIHLEQCDIMDIFNGILFLPLHKNTFLLIQSFINLLEDSFPQVSYTVFLYNDQLVWSGLEQEDMRVLYCYLTGSLLPGYVASELQGGESSRVAQGHYGKYIVGPPNINDEKLGTGKTMKVYLASSEKGTEFTLVVYRALSATICMLLNGNVEVSFDAYKRLDKFLGPQLSSLASSIAEHYVKAVASTSSSDVQCKYVYFNCMNLAVKTTVHSDGKKHGSISIPSDLLGIITDLHQECPAGDSGNEYETFVRAEGDYWVVAKKSDRREFYVIMNQKNANLSEISEDMKKLCSSQFSNIFFLD